jgi:ATP synthase protein I
MMPNERQEPTRGEDEVAQRIDRDVARKLKARSEGRKGVWFGFGMFGLVGWSVAVPSVLGLALGLWIDAHYPSRVSWTLTCLIFGVALGCFNAWYWVRQESRLG